MLGTLRFVLALLVVLNHLWLPVANKIGAHAVLGFYVISGFLMTRILCETYFGWAGLGRYFLNRFLRIFPVYWLIAALTLIGLVLLPEYFGNIHASIRIPQTGYEWLQNITLFDFINAPLRVVPPAWSLSVEWVFYIFIAVVISHRKKLAVIWWLLSISYTIFLVIVGASFGDRYTPPVAASLFFSTGAVIYHWRKSLYTSSQGRGWLTWLLQLALFCIFPLVIEGIGLDPHMIGFYGAYMLFISLFVKSMSMDFQSEWWKKFDHLLGDLAYPVFLSHYLAAGFTKLFAGNGVHSGGASYVMISILLCVYITSNS